ncbi:MAG: hypothetical protein AB4041_02995 [Microcystaceae cyanobacterium]
MYSDSDRQNWRQALELALTAPISSLKAVSYTKAWRTKSEPVLLKCENNQDYVVKTQLAGRQIINDQIVARLGQLLDAPVGIPKIILISQDLIDIEPHLKDYPVGKAHGTQWIPDCFDEWTLIATSEPKNRLRLVLLAILYGWTIANDHQFLFKQNPPRLIYSVDHGHFFPNKPNWTINALLNAPSACLDPYFNQCGFSDQELSYAYQQLENITPIQLIDVIAAIPTEWNITIEERGVMIEYLIKRQQTLLDYLRNY